MTREGHNGAAILGGGFGVSFVWEEEGAGAGGGEKGKGKL